MVIKQSSPEARTYNPPLLPFFSFISIAFFIYYLLWRATSTINPQFPFFSWLLWAAEAFGVFSYILFTIFTKNIDPLRPYVKPADGLKVDIFIPTYNEDVDIVEATLIGCGKITYPHTTYVLDDGDRPQVRELAARLGCEYITRPTHEYAKAGNMNYALQRTSGDFIVFLDADMVPQPSYLDRTLGYFEDEKLALIQLPQEFYNQDSIQHAAKVTPWHEQSLFFRVIQPGKNYTNSSFWCGSPSIVRRKALLDIGGVATETVTEDIHTSVRLHSKGWKTLFVNEPLAFGIAPQTIKAFLVQRLRWAQGTMQLYRSKECPIWIPGLTFKQRLSYFSSFLAYFESFQKLILILYPVIILSFDIFPMKVAIVPFLLHWTPYFALNVFANQLGGRGVFNYLKIEKYNILKALVFVKGTFTLFSKKPLEFKVTPKTIGTSVYRQERTELSGYIAILGLIIIAMAYALIKVIVVPSERVYQESFIIALIWSAYNSFILFLALREILTKRHERKKYRFPVAAEGEILDAYSDKVLADSTVIDLSITGAGVLADKEVTEETRIMNLKVKPEKFADISLPIEKLTNRRQQQSGKNYIGIAFTDDLGPQRNLLFEYLFIHLPKSDESVLYRVNHWNPLNLFQRSTPK